MILEWPELLNLLYAMSDSIEFFIKMVFLLTADIKAVYLDCIFYNNTCPKLLCAHNYAGVVPTGK